MQIVRRLNNSTAIIASAIGLISNIRATALPLVYVGWGNYPVTPSKAGLWFISPWRGSATTTHFNKDAYNSTEWRQTDVTATQCVFKLRSSPKPFRLFTSIHNLSYVTTTQLFNNNLQARQTKLTRSDVGRLLLASEITSDFECCLRSSSSTRFVATAWLRAVSVE